MYLGIRRCPLFNQTTPFDHKLDRVKRGFLQPQRPPKRWATCCESSGRRPRCL